MAPALVFAAWEDSLNARASKHFWRETMTRPQLNIVIIGGGIGGLFAANALIAHGCNVSVHEQAPALGEVGAGVFLTP